MPGGFFTNAGGGEVKVRQWLRRFLGMNRSSQKGDISLQSGKMPQHVAIIMDGNGRWANNRGLPRTRGHQKGMERLRQVVAASCKYGIKTLTLYAFSTENWQRPREEVDFLMALPQVYLERELPELQRNNVRVCFLGRTGDLPPGTRRALEVALRETAVNSGLILNIAINYGGRAEILDAVRKIAMQVQEGGLDPAGITEDTVTSHLYTAGISDPDLLIRTGGEARLSNFLLWQVAYTELWFTPVLWPDFDEEEYKKALAAFQARERRYGRIPGENG
jgi:undecaprenyl diphosphate synthase